jgi:hypothetical protein
MAEFPVPLDNLIAYVNALHPDGDPLERVTDAFAVSARLDEQSDALLGYFVDQARRSGAPWSQIGAAMGVSKQAAQKRFVPGKLTDLSPEGAVFSRFTQRARNVLAAAGGIASPPSDPLIGAAHLGAAELVEPEGIAAKVITKAGPAGLLRSGCRSRDACPGCDRRNAERTRLRRDREGRAEGRAEVGPSPGP